MDKLTNEQKDLIREVFIWVRNKIKDPTDEYSIFICNEIRMYFDYAYKYSPRTYNPHELTMNYFISKRPSPKQYKRFYNHKLFRQEGEVKYAWWRTHAVNRIKASEQRVKFLDKLIKEL